MTDTNSIYNQLGVSDQVLRFGQHFAVRTICQ